MKKIIYFILILALAGTVLSGILLIQHFYPYSKMGIISCGDGLINPCLELSQSKFSTLFGIPVAAYGLLFYLAILFILLIADYAGEKYINFSLAILLPPVIFSIIADIALLTVLITTGFFCPKCIATYIINLLILTGLIFWHRKTKAESGSTIPGIYREIFNLKTASPDRKAFFSAFILFIFLLSFSVLLPSYIEATKTEKFKPSAARIKLFLKNFYQSKTGKIDIPQNGILLGNPDADITIISFTDFLCSACYKFYEAEKYLFSKYKDRIKVIYFNYPLDPDCNSDVKRAVYGNSCIASRAITAASECGFLKEYIIKHFADYKKIRSGYGLDAALTKLEEVERDKLNGIDRNRFLEIMNSERVLEIIESHVELSKKMNINATPTLFIAGRKIVGVPPVEMLDAVIEKELKKK